MPHKQSATIEELLDLFEYDPNDEKLYRKRRAVSHDRKTGYPAIYLPGGRIIYAHRLVWMLANGPIPKGMEIDHIDRDKMNYRLSNLRLVTPFQNKLNRIIRQVHPDQGIHRRSTGNYEVRISIAGKRKTIATFKNIDQARACREKVLAEKYVVMGVLE